MLERLKEKVSRRPEENKQWFEKDCVFEDLIIEGRIPSFWDAGEVTLVVLPPEGVKPGDECELIFGGGMEFFASNGGPSKGLASLYEVSTKTAAKLKDRKNKVLEEMGLSTS